MERTPRQTFSQQVDIARKIYLRGDRERYFSLVATIAGLQNACDIEAIYYEFREN